ncbi:hypothetical protein NC661_04945 [Aquibacillus koreensis]|uniref:Uncharacterized protein n=1 Tax=Aquibacillus koreensis TaxID=279446 RepID=A0A9X3WGZ0_9BACI|nr:hypothetical protein [Aquibacillus koreensis]
MIGGFSTPVLNKDVAANHAHSLDGKTFEEIQSDMSEAEWIDNWNGTYSDHIDFDYE